MIVDQLGLVLDAIDHLKAARKGILREIRAGAGGASTQTLVEQLNTALLAALEVRATLVEGALDETKVAYHVRGERARA